MFSIKTLLTGAQLRRVPAVNRMANLSMSGHQLWLVAFIQLMINRRGAQSQQTSAVSVRDGSELLVAVAAGDRLAAMDGR
ncbi:unnamed protein product [Nippostrongylus brasiliensis]|uniref:Flagellar biosynthesis protein FlgA n=1 Tax=Nippostrongylus brasiliensis TaxID=27835 RepID=A0A0N4YKQ7_NIPBR|nr:unnamed protein product [Nippostrongylus brasiliensis]